MEAMKADLKAVDKKIKEFIDNDPLLKELFDTAECRPVDSVKGIGIVIATEVLITTNEFKVAGDPDITDPKNIVVGGVPLIAVSLPLNIHVVRHPQVNTKARPKSVIKLIKKVKALFHNGTMSTIQHCTEIKGYRAANRYQRKVGEGKMKCSLLTIFVKVNPSYFVCISRREKYNENYIQTFA